MIKKEYITASFSGGKDSTAMVLRLIELGERLDEVVCCDTFKEFPAMYRHIEKVKKVVENAGIKFTMLKSEKSFDFYMFELKVNRRNLNNHNVGYSWAGPKNRWCTTKLKVNIINRYFNQLRKKYNIIQYIGIASDEVYRLDRKNNRKAGMYYPLVIWGWSEKDCLEYCYSKGYNWEGLYIIFNRVSCWCCPLQPLEELRKLRKHFPELWQELKEMDKRTWRQFRFDYSVEELEKRFVFEEMRLLKGLSITNSEFYIELKEYLGIPVKGQISMFNIIDN